MQDFFILYIAVNMFGCSCQVKFNSNSNMIFFQYEQLMMIIWQWSLLLSIGIPQQQTSFGKSRSKRRDLHDVTWEYWNFGFNDDYDYGGDGGGVQRNNKKILACRYSLDRNISCCGAACMDFFDSCRTNCRVLAFIHNNIHYHH